MYDSLREDNRQCCIPRLKDTGNAAQVLSKAGHLARLQRNLQTASVLAFLMVVLMYCGPKSRLAVLLMDVMLSAPHTCTRTVTTPQLASPQTVVLAAHSRQKEPLQPQRVQARKALHVLRTVRLDAGRALETLCSCSLSLQLIPGLCPLLLTL